MSQFFDTIREPKINLAATLKGEQINSIRDFGGMWKVNGLYLLEAAKSLQPKWAEMVDNICTPEFKDSQEKLKPQGIDVRYTQADFSDVGYLDLEPADVSLFYDVLLHQDNFVEVIRQVGKITNKYICVVQPFYENFNYPDACSLIQFMTPEEKKSMACEMWSTIDAPRERFDVNVWMWAQSRRLISDVFKGYGWIETGETFNFPMPPQGSNWVYSGMIFKKA